jgi:hypothetical protein
LYARFPKDFGCASPGRHRDFSNGAGIMAKMIAAISRWRQ